MYQTIACNTADEFWSYLDPTNPLKKDFSREEKKQLLYRGQEDSQFKLLPACFRKHFNKKTYESTITAEEQVKNEYEEFIHFVRSQEYIEETKKGIFKREEELISENLRFQIFQNPSIWPPENLYKTLFLAQHHGAATRLLVWSKKSHIAVYFACQPILYDRRNDRTRLNGEIAVWCYLPNMASSNVIIEDVPNNIDKNIIAQSGRFSLVTQDMSNPKSGFKIKTLDDIETEQNLWKLTVPKKEIYSLLIKCDDEDINAESVYKGKRLDCVAMSYRENDMLENEIKTHKLTYLIDGLSDA